MFEGGHRKEEVRLRKSTPRLAACLQKNSPAKEDGFVDLQNSTIEER
jgi:hypothetical protein